jgi:hypothetical protein
MCRGGDLVPAIAVFVVSSGIDTIRWGVWFCLSFAVEIPGFCLFLFMGRECIVASYFGCGHL